MQENDPGKTRRLAVAAPLCLFLILCAVLFAQVCRINGGRFTYTLDDAYIHLALAENIAQGNYGLNLNEMSAPASSILWPFLMAPFVWLGLAEYAPIVINIVLAAVTLVVCARFIGDTLSDAGERRRNALVAVGLICLIPLLNLAALAFTGMEHSLQVLLSILLLLALVRESKTGDVTPMLFGALILGPLVRYENVALSAPALLYLLLRRHFRFAIGAGLVMALSLGGFSLFLLGNGLAYLPTSVMAKSDAASTGGKLAAVLANLHFNIRNRQGTVLAVMLVFMLAAWLWNQPKERGRQWLAAWGCVAAGVHLLGGSFGWFARYEMYILSISILLLFYLFRAGLIGVLDRAPVWRSALVLAAAVVVIGGPYLRRVLITPLAASNIYEQHAQMQRFVKDYWKQPLAAMDVGFVSYGHDYHVLDLRGLGSLEALRCFEHRDELGSEWMEELTTRYGTKLAILYKFYYHTFPESWTVLGELHLGRPRVIAAFPVVTFYATDKEAVPELHGLLEEFAQTLPPGVRFTFGR